MNTEIFFAIHQKLTNTSAVNEWINSYFSNFESYGIDESIFSAEGM